MRRRADGAKGGPEKKRHKVADEHTGMEIDDAALNKLREEIDSAYFDSYDNVAVHELMLKDKARTLSYRRALERNAEFIKGKVVLDVGAGTGILSMMAAVVGGARKVYAVEGSNMAKVCEVFVAQNNLSSKVTVIHSRVENIDQLPDGCEEVDVIISEWMGHYLLHESMFNSVIVARDRWLAKDGLMLPSRARLYCAPVGLDSYIDERFGFWKDVYGFDLSAMIPAQQQTCMQTDCIRVIEPEAMLALPELLVDFDCHTVTVEELSRFEKVCSFDEDATLRSGACHGLGFWFDTPFDVRSESTNVELEEDSPYFYEDEEMVLLRTDPGAMPTHWKQFVVFLPHFAEITVDKEAGRLLPSFAVELIVDEFNPRQCSVSFAIGAVDGAGGDVVMGGESAAQPKKESLKDAIVRAFLAERSD